MYRENAPKNPSELLSLQPNAAGFLADADRFHSDTAGEEYLKRKADYSRKQDIYNNTRIQRQENEESRWKKIEEAKSAEEEYWQQQRSLWAVPSMKSRIPVGLFVKTGRKLHARRRSAQRHALPSAQPRGAGQGGRAADTFGP